MAKRLIHLMDEKKRDAHVELEAPKRKKSSGYINAEGEAVHSERLIKSSENHNYSGLIKKFGDDMALGKALVDEDPEIPFELSGRQLGQTDRVWVREDGTILYCARSLLVTYDTSGEEVERADFIDVEATVAPDTALPWTGRLFPTAEVVRRFVIGRRVRVRHINGLTFDFLYDIAKHLYEEEKMLLLGTGKRGAGPLIFQTNGTPYRGFLEGRIDKDGYLLLLHLSNLELKSVKK